MLLPAKGLFIYMLFCINFYMFPKCPLQVPPSLLLSRASPISSLRIRY